MNLLQRPNLHNIIQRSTNQQPRQGKNQFQILLFKNNCHFIIDYETNVTGGPLRCVIASGSVTQSVVNKALR